METAEGGAVVSAVWSVVLTTEVRRAEVRSMPDGGARWGYRSAVARGEGGLRLSWKAFEKRSRTCRQPVHLGERERESSCRSLRCSFQGW